MKLHRTTIALALLCLAVLTASSVLAAGEPGAGGAQAMSTKTIDLPSLSTAPENQFPYTVDVPVTWQPRREIPAIGVFVGPPSAQPEVDHDMIFVRASNVDLTNPEAVVATIRANAETQPWDASELDVIDIGGRLGVWVLLEVPATPEKPARKTLTLKLPLDDGSLDVLASAPSDQFDELRGTFETVLRSIRPKAATEEAEAGSDG